MNDTTSAGKALERRIAYGSPVWPRPVRPRSVNFGAPLLLLLAIGLLIAAISISSGASEIATRRGQRIEHSVMPDLPANTVGSVDLTPDLRGCPVEVTRISPSEALGAQPGLLTNFEFRFDVRPTAPLGRTICTIDWGDFNQEFTINIEEIP